MAWNIVEWSALPKAESAVFGEIKEDEVFILTLVRKEKPSEFERVRAIKKKAPEGDFFALPIEGDSRGKEIFLGPHDEFSLETADDHPVEKIIP